MDPRHRLVTRKDVAELAGVSPTIVSYVINNNRYVDNEKRERVLKAIKELNYQPNAVAKSLKLRKSYHIAFICDDIANEHFARIVMEMESIAYNNGYIVSLCYSRDDDEYINQIVSRQFDGIVISTNRISEDRINKLAQSGIPTVLIGNRMYKNISEDISLVNINIYEGARKAIEYLVKTGHKRIAFIDNRMRKDEVLNENDLRIKAYLDVLKDNNIDIKTDYIIYYVRDYKEIYQRCYNMFKMPDRPTAIFAHDDMHAAVAISAINNAGLKIPDDVAVIGFDNSTLSNYTTPAMTTVEIPRAIMGKVTMELLLSKMEGKVTRDINLDTTLVIRDST